ncbi:NAD(P)/FAD-dependent oxidoreductase [Raoultibacter phocaeensis]|uniref:NAD(P)/FAD-dependent oxidoreductase n=1 Tax=Raoultibacter phocaeensis TaxID=2479841 RepID=UPI001118C804|nr:FAD-dependent monooxygenase [Raoultibacter phocaeensis]
MIEVPNVQVPLDAFSPGCDRGPLLRAAAAKALGLAPGELSEVRLAKRSVDARKKSDVHFACTLVVGLADAAREERLVAAGAKRHVPYEPLSVRDLSKRTESGSRPVVAGAGPAGLFAALYLARAGLRPLLVERGPAVEERIRAVAEFERTGRLDEQANIQFGEGGAGTFSDGKLTTNTKNPYAKHVLAWFVEAGAPEEILWQAKPHIGTDRLVSVVRSMREEIERAGGSARFETQLSSLSFSKGALSAVELLDVRTGARETVGAEQVVLACGHSARDTFAMLRDAGIAMERKPFSVGVRIEHSQRDISRAQYGSAADHPALGAAEYKLAVHLPSGRGVYTFCMCPGGEVVCAASEGGGVAVNGMSRFARDGENANSALLVGVDPADFGGDDVLAGVEFQRAIERAAYRCAAEAGGAPYAAPAQTVGDFLAGRAGCPSDRVRPTCPRGVAWCDLRECLPGFVADALAEALPLLDRKLSGFADAQAVLTGVETRSSSPVRIVRDGGFQAQWAGEPSGGPDGSACPAGVGGPGGGSGTGDCSGAGRASGSGDGSGGEARRSAATGLYPCGEGAGYAGGIMSAAVDGLRVAEALAADWVIAD